MSRFVACGLGKAGARSSIKLHHLQTLMPSLGGIGLGKKTTVSDERGSNMKLRSIGLCVSVTVLLSLALFPITISANTVTFDFSGTLTNGQTVGGSFTVDESIGALGAWDITSQLGCPLAGCPHEYSSAIPGDTGVVNPNPFAQLQLIFQTVGPLETLELKFYRVAYQFCWRKSLTSLEFRVLCSGIRLRRSQHYQLVPR